MISPGVSRNPESHDFPSFSRLAGIALLLIVLFAVASLLNARSWSAGGVTIFWPSNGLLLGVLLCSSRRQWPVWLILAALIDFSANILLGDRALMAGWLTSCNMLEVLLAALPLYPIIAPRPDLTQRRQLISLLLYGMFLAPAVASLLASPAVEHSFYFSGLMLHRFQIWFTADALGITIVTPLYLAFTQSRPFQSRRWNEIISLFALLLLVTILVFWQVRFPLFFLVLPFLLLLGLRLGLAGSALGLLLVAVVGGLFTTMNRGPAALISGGTLSGRILLLQCFLAVSMLVLYIPEVVIAERKRLQQNLQASEARFRLLAEASRDVIVLTDLEGHRDYVSPSVTEVLGWMPEDVIGGSYHQLVHPDDVASLSRLLKDCEEGKPARALPYRCRNSQGEYHWVETNPRLYRDPATGSPAGFVNIVRDISDRRAAEEELNKAFRMVESLATVDGLTGLANRRRFDETLEREWSRAQREQSTLSLLMIDVDHFKRYNDAYGHLAGDDCLRRIAQSIALFAGRSADLAARYGGEEFAIILPGTAASGSLEVAQRILADVEQCRIPHSNNAAWDVVTISIGSATFSPIDGDSCSQLVRIADEALYRAKHAGRNRVEAEDSLSVRRLTGDSGGESVDS
ncbi:bifunctional diguanylate cyclase/phosphodiesterase [Paracidobacterium acidisoli]|uniref:diguanylate cyclase n=1 Tax=Paracidobacterium acidisoli TaxID=2303751 RepID=A0A372IJV0_9BACT|nr:GGDEF domain-containing protein [Paracidobacterium acidisoli]MBT9332566.1 diguanylate cyclase [Paracidobacterium acidisoli]